MTTSLKETQEIKNVCDRLFISKYNAQFYKFLESLDDNTKHMIRHNNKLNDMYDLFLDFVIDSSNHLDRNHAKELTSNIQETSWLVWKFLYYYVMWDPISLIFCMYVMNIDMPAARLDVLEVIQQQRAGLVDCRVNLREGV